jgi:LemA protein
MAQPLLAATKASSIALRTNGARFMARPPTLRWRSRQYVGAVRRELPFKRGKTGLFVGLDPLPGGFRRVRSARKIARPTRWGGGVIWIVAALIVAVAVYGVWIFNRLVSDRNLVAQAFADIDVQLKRRADLVPRLVDVVKTYASYERATLTAVTALRAQLATIAAGPSAQRFAVEGGLGQALHRLLVLQENYPALKADANFRDLAAKLVDIEDHLQLARRFYNGAVKQYVTRLQTFPGLLIARPFAFRPAAFFESDDRDAVRVQL